MSNRDLTTQPKMRRSVQVGYRRLARPVVWPVIARASAPAETPDPPSEARTFPWGMMERVRQALADEPAPPAPRRSRERPAAVADAEPQVRRQVVVEEAPARPRPAAIPDAEPDSGPLLQAQPEPEEEGLSTAQAAPPDADQATPSDLPIAPPEVGRPAWDDRGESSDRQSPPQPEYAAPEPVAEPGTPQAEAAPRPPSAAESSSRASDVPHATAVQRTASQDAPAAASAGANGQAVEQPGMTSLPPAYPTEEQPAPDDAAVLSSVGGKLPTQPPASQEPEVTPATAEPEVNLQSARSDLWPASPQAALPAVAPIQSEEESPGQAMPAAEVGSVQRAPEGRLQATPGNRTEPASPPQAEPGEGDAPTGGQGEWPAAAPTLAEAVESVQAQPAEVEQEFAEVRREPVLPTKAGQEPTPPTQVSRRPIPPVEVRQETVPPTEVRQGPVSPVEVRKETVPPTEVRQSPISPVEARQETVPQTEVRRVLAPPADSGLIQRSPAPRAQSPVGTLSSAKRQTRGAPGAAGEMAAGPGPEDGVWGSGSAQAASFDAPAVVQAAQAADESTAPAATPPSSSSPFKANSAPAAADVDTLARQVYQILRRRLQVEYERNLGHGR